MIRSLKPCWKLFTYFPHNDKFELGKGLGPNGKQFQSERQIQALGKQWSLEKSVRLPVGGQSKMSSQANPLTYFCTKNAGRVGAMKIWHTYIVKVD